jgi:hypothetical protein
VPEIGEKRLPGKDREREREREIEKDDDVTS